MSSKTLLDFEFFSIAREKHWVTERCRRPIPPEMAEKPPSLRMVGPADYGLRTGCVGVLKREHQRRLSAPNRLARSIGAAQRGCGSCNSSVGRKLGLAESAELNHVSADVCEQQRTPLPRRGTRFHLERKAV